MQQNHFSEGSSQPYRPSSKKQEKSQINNIIYHLKELEKEEQNLVSRRKEILKIREEINKIEIKKTIEKINKTKSWFFKRLNNINKPLARLTKKKRERTQINKVRNEKGDITTNTTEVQKTIREYYDQLYANKLDNLEEMDKFLETYNLSRQNHKEIENLNRLITSNKIDTIIFKTPKKQLQIQMASQVISTKHLKKS